MRLRPEQQVDAATPEATGRRVLRASQVRCSAGENPFRNPPRSFLFLFSIFGAFLFPVFFSIYLCIIIFSSPSLFLFFPFAPSSFLFIFFSFLLFFPFNVLFYCLCEHRLHRQERTGKYSGQGRRGGPFIPCVWCVNIIEVNRVGGGRGEGVVSSQALTSLLRVASAVDAPSCRLHALLHDLLHLQSCRRSWPLLHVIL